MSTLPNEPYRVLARRFRPRSFDELVGQEAVLNGLRSAIASGRIPHAMLFSGSRGVGKTTLARIVARCVNCERGPTAEPCGECAACRSILDGNNPDVVEIDAASHNLVDDIRELRERVGFASMGSRYKVYILDEVHMLTRNAFNAFLKTLEEPPANVLFLMATTELHKVPDTIRSRCQVHLLRRIGEMDIVRRLSDLCAREQIDVGDGVLDDIARSSRGGMRDAETALERLLPLARERGVVDLEAYRAISHRVGFDAALDVVEELVLGRAGAALRFAADVAEAGADEREALGEVLEVLRAVLLLQVDGAESPLVVQVDEERQRLGVLAAVDAGRIEAMIQAGLLGRERIRRLEDRRLVLELTLVRMAEAGTLPALGELLHAARQGAAVATASPRSEPRASRSVAAPAPAPAPASERGPAGLRERLLSRLSGEAPLLVRTLELCAVRGPDAKGAVEFEIGAEHKLHHDRLRADGVQQQLRKVLGELLGAPVAVRLVVGGAAPNPGLPGDEPAATPATPPQTGGRRRPPSEKIQRIADAFDGQIVDADDAPTQ